MKKKQNKPKVSILMAVYNEEKTVYKCIQSVLQQSFFNFEFLIVDDKSSDKTSYILRNLSQRDKRIKLYFSKKNRGLTASINFLIKKANSDIIARIDGDDYWLREKLRLQYYLLFLSRYSLVGSNCYYIKNTRLLKSNLPLSNEIIKKNIFFYNPFVHSSVVFKKKISQNIYQNKYLKCQDYYAWTKILFNKRGFVKNIARPLVFHNINKKYHFLSLINSIKVKLYILRYLKEKKIFYYTYILFYFLKNLVKYILNLK